MKLPFRILALALAIIFALSAIACSSSGSNGSGGPSDQGRPGGSEGGGTGGGSGSGDRNPTLLDRAIELAESVDKLPTSTQLHDEGGARALMSHLPKLTPTLASASLGGIDVSDPKDNPDYEGYLGSGRLTQDVYFVTSGYGDQMIEVVRMIKDHAVSNVVQLDSWVDGFQFQYAKKIKLSYDAENDTVHIHALDDDVIDGLFYTKIAATYTAQGKAVVSAYVCEIKADGLTNQYDIYYAEDDRWSVNCTKTDGTSPHEYSFISRADLSVPERRIITLMRGGAAFKEKGQGGEPDRYFVTEYVTYPLYDPELNTSIPEGGRIGQSLYYLNTAAGERVGYINCHDSGISISLDVYELEGWDKLYLKDSQYVLKVGDRIFGSDFIRVDLGGYETDIAVINQLHANLHIAVFNPGQKNVEQVAGDVMRLLGLSFKDKSVTGRVADADKLHDFRAKFKIDRYDGNYPLTEEFFFDYVEGLIIPPHTTEEIVAFLNASATDKDSQTPNEDYYKIHNVSISGGVGEAALEEDKITADFSEIIMTANETALLSKDALYAYRIMLSNGTESKTVCEIPVTYADGAFRATEKGTLSFEDIPEGEYDLLICLVVKDGDRSTRIGSICPLVAEGEASYEMEIGDSTIALTATDKEISVSREPKPMEAGGPDISDPATPGEGEASGGESSETKPSEGDASLNEQ